MVTPDYEGNHEGLHFKAWDSVLRRIQEQSFKFLTLSDFSLEKTQGLKRVLEVWYISTSASSMVE